ncbi:NmrA/HSCARG family protein [Confluentibacter flavum]|uniref:NmrA-like domain-containing protein n=1 Tax=Confluentibacter flavum TaxID=1909700 RepID=A0A2N3HKV3_9FLAO|nr:NmrA/HSCARG family protein [Confluentibacter flavum]PKQ45514.1 hypothetical protein CSW08_07630 [Confluentibacter flavum]
MEHKKNIFITGITGNQGSAVAKHLLEQNNSVIGLTRNANSEKAKQWKERGVTVIEGNINNPDSFQSYLDQADAVYLVQALQRKDREILEGKRFIDAIKPENETHLVYASVLGSDLDTAVPHFESKFELENYIKSKNLNYSILRPASFYENHLFPRVANDIKKGKYISPLNKMCNQQMIGVDDIGKIAATVISNKEKYNNKTISIATDEWQIGKIPQVFSETINKPVSYKKLPGFITRLAMGKDLSKMFKYMNQNDFCVINNIQEVRDEFDISGDFRSWVHKNFTP